MPRTYQLDTITIIGEPAYLLQKCPPFREGAKNHFLFPVDFLFPLTPKGEKIYINFKIIKKMYKRGSIHHSLIFISMKFRYPDDLETEGSAKLNLILHTADSRVTHPIILDSFLRMTLNQSFIRTNVHLTSCIGPPAS